MKITQTKILLASALLFMTASAQALQPELLYAFQQGPRHPSGSLIQGTDGNFYGAIGDGDGYGTIFKVTTNGVWTTLVKFNGTNGATPQAGLVLGSDGHLYGTTYSTVFQVTTNGFLTTLVSFSSPLDNGSGTYTNADGAYPQAGLLLGSDGNFYGTTAYGGSAGRGTVFKVTTNGLLTTLFSFNGTNGADPRAGLVLGRDGNFYGTTYIGGGSNVGTVFKVTTNGVLTTLVSFSGTNGAHPEAGLVLGNDGDFHGTTDSGGTSNLGTLFKVTPDGVLTTLVSFNGTNGAGPYGELLLSSDSHFYGTTAYGGGGATGPWTGSGTVFKVTTNGVLTSLVSFNDTNGAHPEAGLVLGRDGNFYGTTAWGGSSSTSYGTVFKMTPDGVLTTLVSVPGADAAYPQAGLALGSDGNLYGTCFAGSWGDGMIFKLTTNGVLTTLVSFNGTNGAYPRGELLLSSDGHFYGTTRDGGGSGFGTVFQVTTNGVLTTLVSFAGTNGQRPDAGLVLGNDGNFYGTTGYGGSGATGPWTGSGTVFKVTTNGVLTSLVSFSGANGANPYAGLVLGSDGAFYGTTSGGGSDGWGTVFKVTTNGVLTTLVSFNYTNGANPEAGLVFGSDGNLYGTTSGGGSTSQGTVFQVTTNGVLTTLVAFNGANGSNPQTGLVLGRDGNFYGTTAGNHILGSFYIGSTAFQMTTNAVLTTLFEFGGNNGTAPNGAAPNELVLGKDGYIYGTTRHGGPAGGGTIFRLVISAFTSVVRQPSGSVLLTGTGPFNGSYRLWASTDLSLPVAFWVLLTSASFDSSGNFSYTDASAATNSSRFYQLSVP